MIRLEPAALPLLDLRLTALALRGQPVLHDIQLQLQRGETLALLGPSGIGKTSLLRVIAGLNPDFEGHCHLVGSCAVVFQEPTLLPWLDVLRNICVPTGATPTQARNALEEVGLAARERDYPDQLSLGQQRRLALARARARHNERYDSLNEHLTNDLQFRARRFCLPAMHDAHCDMFGV